MGNTLQKKKGFSMPHVYAVILILMLLVTIMTYVVPAGNYVRVDGAVDPNSFAYAEQTPVGFLDFFTAIHQGVVESSSIIGAVLLISGCIQIIQYTGAFSAGIQTLIRKANGKGLAMVILFFTLFTGLGVIGYLDALYPFYPSLFPCSSHWVMTKWWVLPLSCCPPRSASPAVWSIPTPPVWLRAWLVCPCTPVLDSVLSVW